MQAYTEEQRAAEIEQTKELRNHLNFWGHASGFSPEFLMRVTDAYLAALTAKPFMYGIMDADGAAHMDECCVSTTLVGVSDSVDVLNEELTEEGDPQYKPVALFTEPPVYALRLPDEWTLADAESFIRDMTPPSFEEAALFARNGLLDEVKRLNAIAQAALAVSYGAMPESNGKSNWTAMLHRKAEGIMGPYLTIAVSEFPDRVRYEADMARFLIGELSEEPDILDYDADKHSGYVPPASAPAVPAGWKLVPAEPTAAMIDAVVEVVLKERREAMNGGKNETVPRDYIMAAFAAAPEMENAK
ncbi:hypothetical protein [Pantoea septica]|uniref:hypothetical protein n=1 Tax=Pantoea septica TaxID=472695 RepID=UPI0023F83F6F|nr:hypothetical protein [Pantoea septica]